MFLSLPAKAQYFYNNIGDTIRGLCPIYYQYDYWPVNYLKNNPDKNGGDYYGNFFTPDTILSGHHFNGEILKYNYTDQPLKILGIAGCVNLGQTRVPEYFLLYDYGEQRDTFFLAGALEVRSTDTIRRHMEIDERGKGFTCCFYDTTVTKKTLNVIEEYFDKPIVVTDSFYVGVSSYSKVWGQEYVNYITGVMLFSTYNYYPIRGCDNTGCPQVTPYSLYKYRLLYETTFAGNYYWMTPIANPVWTWMEFPQYLMVFPIIEVDTSYAYVCPQVSNLHVESVATIGDTTNCVVLLWNSIGASDTTYELCYGPAGSAPEQCTTLFSQYPAKSICGLDSCTHYVVYVRAKCHRGSIEFYSPWSDGIDIYICDKPDDNAVGDILDRFTYLMPNPASSQVRVASSYSLTSVEAYDLGGRKVLDMKAAGLTAEFSVEGWPKGTYVVVIHTPTGTATKKLVVE